MDIAQKLYEQGYITYMRTDSPNISQNAINDCKKYIIDTFGTEYSDPKNYSGKDNAQEAHECIRPTHLDQPTIDKLEGDNVMFYSIYDNGAKAAMGNFASFEAIPGIEVRTVFFDPVNSLVSGDMTEQEWIDGIISASDQMRANLK